MRASQDDERILDALERIDEALASGQPQQVEEALATFQPAERQKLEKLVECLRLLSPTESDSAQCRPSVPKTIGRFLVLRELGRGSFGVVFLALDPDLGREVALKIPRVRGWLDPAVKSRFLREARAAARLNHPHILPVFETGEVDETLYIATAYSPGPTLSEWIRGRSEPVPVPLAAGIVLQLASAVAHAHERAVFHRDLKPGNVLLEPASEFGRNFPYTPRLSDFGLAKVPDEEAPVGQTPCVVGTPEYMPPEQAAGVSDAGAAADVYGLGAILYELLSGRPPYQGSSREQILSNVASGPPTPLSQVRVGLPRDIVVLCEKCLARAPGERYSSAAELAADVERFLTGRPILARRGFPGESLLRGWGKEGGGPALFRTMLVLFAATAASALWLQARLVETQSKAIEVRAQAIQSEVQAAQSRMLARELAYASDLKTAFEAWENADVQHALSLLQRQIPAPGEPDHRGLEWHFLWSVLRGGSTVVGEHPGGARAVAWSPTERLVASIGIGGRLVLWDVDLGAPRAAFAAHGGVDATDLCFFPDGAKIATAGDDGAVRLWSTRDGAPQGELKAPDGWVGAVAVAPNGGWIASGHGNGSLRLWSAGGKMERSIPAHAQAVRSVAFHPSQPWLITASQDRTIRVWRTDDLSLLGDIPPLDAGPDFEAAWPRGLAIEPTGESLVASYSNGTVVQYDLRRNRWLRAILEREVEGGGRDVVFSANGRRLALAMHDTTIQFRAAKDGFQAAIGVFRGHEHRVDALAFSPDERWIASASRDGTVRLWDLRDEAGQRLLSTLPAKAALLAYDPSASRLAVADVLGCVRILDAKTGSIQQQVCFDPDGLQMVRLGVGGSVILTLSRRGELERFNERGERLGEPLFCANVNDVRLAPDDRSFAVAEDQIVRIREVGSGRAVRDLRHPAAVFAIAYDPAGTRIATGCADGLLRVWNVADGVLVRTFSGHKDEIASVGWCCGGNWIASGSSDRSAKIWDAESGKSVGHFGGHDGPVHLVAIFPDRRSLLTIDQHQTMRCWNVPTGQEIVAKGNVARAEQVAVSPRGDAVAVCAGRDVNLIRGD